MAPISAETEAITSCLPQHVGPPIPEATSVWFQLYLYHVAQAGPPSLLFSRGRRVRKLPHLFRHCESVQLLSWRRDPVIVHVTGLLPVLNETLLESPVFVQVYSEETVDIPFPFNLGKKMRKNRLTNPDDKENPLLAQPEVRRIQEALKLESSFGYLKMMRLPQSEEWVPFGLYWGIPLADKELNKQVCDKVVQYGLFSQENLQLHSRNTRALCLRLLDFIAEYQLEALDVDSGKIPFPCKDILFRDGKLQDIDREDL